MADTYSEAFYRAVREGARKSAEALVPVLWDRYQPASVIDVGCGEGLWGAEFGRRGADVVGIDSGEVEPLIERIDHDLEEPFPKLGEYDLALCLEVAEHLSPERASTFVTELANLAPIIVFSAAIPGQGGHNHTNEQWPAYWVERFERNDLLGSGALRWEVWEDDRISVWYRQNLLIFGDSDLPTDGCPGVVHPAFWSGYR